MLKYKHNLIESGWFGALHKITPAAKDDSERRLKQVEVPTLVIMDTDDPDFPDAEAEAAYQAKIHGAKKVRIDGAGHHPQVDPPGIVTTTLIDFFSISPNSS